MKNSILFLLALIVFFACKKEGDAEREMKPANLCTIVLADSVPVAVKNAFAVKYSKQTVIKWYSKTGAGYVAYFKNFGVNMLALFTADGTFVKDETEINNQQQGQYTDSASFAGKNLGIGCECELDGD